MRFFLPAAAVAALVLLATACSSTSSPGSAQRTGGAASSVAASPNVGLLTGTQLKARLAPASWFPSGFTVDPDGSVDTGSFYQPPSSASGPPHCTRLDATSWVELAGVGSVSFAQNDYINRNTSEQFAQEVDAYRGASAQRVMTGLRKLADICPSFRDSQTSSTVTVKLTKGPQLGDDALTFTLNSPRWQGDTTLIAVRAGTAVITVLHSASSGTGRAEATKLAAVITANLKKKS